MFVFVHIPPIFSVLLTYSLKISSLLFMTHPVCLWPDSLHVTCGLTACTLHRDQLRAQRSVTSMGKLYLLLLPCMCGRCKMVEAIIDQCVPKVVWSNGCASAVVVGILVVNGWRRGVVVSGVRRMNEFNARRDRLVLWLVTVFGRVYHLGMYQAN